MSPKPKINIDYIKRSVASDEFIISNHARERAFEREVTTDQIILAIIDGIILNRDNENDPCPRVRIKANIDGRSLIVVVDQCKKSIVIVSVYIDKK